VQVSYSVNHRRSADIWRITAHRPPKQELRELCIDYIQYVT